MLQNLRQSEASLIATVREATAALNAVGTGELSAALAELEAAKEAAVARLKLAASITQLTVQHVADEADGLTEQLRAGLFGEPQPAAEPLPEPVTTSPVSEPLTLLNPDADHEAQPAGDAPEQPRYRTGFALVDAMLDAVRETQPEAEPSSVTVAANGPVEPARVKTFCMADQVEATAHFIEALQAQARDGATRENVEAGLDSLALESWHKRDLLALARRLSRDVSGKPGKAELVRMVRACVLDVQALCGFRN